MAPLRFTRARRRVAAILTAGLLTGALAAIPASAAESGDSEACTPGYWKTHTDNWLENPGQLIPTDRTLGSIFDLAAYPHLADDTLLEALNYNAFRGDEGSLRNLLKHAVAAFLNAAYDDGEGHLQYPLRRNGQGDGPQGFLGIVPEVDAAIASGDREAMLALKDLFDSIANELDCPLS